MVEKNILIWFIACFAMWSIALTVILLVRLGLALYDFSNGYKIMPDFRYFSHRNTEDKEYLFTNITLIICQIIVFCLVFYFSKDFNGLVNLFWEVRKYNLESVKNIGFFDEVWISILGALVYIVAFITPNLMFHLFNYLLTKIIYQPFFESLSYQNNSPPNISKKVQHFKDEKPCFLNNWGLKVLKNTSINVGVTVFTYLIILGIKKILDINIEIPEVSFWTFAAIAITVVKSYFSSD